MIHGLYDRLRMHGPKMMLFVVNFGIARICVYLVPLLIARIAPPDVYAAVEFAQSVSMLVAAVIVAAPLAGVSQRFLVNREALSVDIAAAAVVFACGISLAAGTILWIAGVTPIAIASGLALGLAALHTAISTVFRTLSLRNIVAWTDGFAIIVTLCIVAVALAIGGIDVTRLALGYGIATLLALATALIVWVRWRRAGFGHRLAIMARFGAPVLVSSAFAFWQAGAGRILTGLFAASALPAYGIAFRIAGLALGFHQLAVTAFFARIYAGRTRVIDRLLALLLVTIVGALIFVEVAARFVVTLGTFAALDAKGLALFHAVLPIVAVQIFYWIANAMLEQRLARFRLAARTILPSIAVNAAGLATLFVIDRTATVTLPVICWVVALQSAASFGVAITILARRRIPHRALATAGGAGGAMLALIALV